MAKQTNSKHAQGQGVGNGGGLKRRGVYLQWLAKDPRLDT